MIDEHNFVLCSRSEGDAYKSSHSAELSLNAAILRAEIGSIRTCRKIIVAGIFTPESFPAKRNVLIFDHS
jgi:hypothetical protein